MVPIFLRVFKSAESISYGVKSSPNLTGRNLVSSAEALLQNEDLTLLTPFNFPTYCLPTNYLPHQDTIMEVRFFLLFLFTRHSADFFHRRFVIDVDDDIY